MSIGFQKKIFDSVLLVESATITSDIFEMSNSDDWGIYVKANVATSSYYATLQVSPDKTASSFVAPSGYPSITTIGGSNATMLNITNYAMRYGRIAITGLSTNPATPSITGYIFAREWY